MLRCLFFGLSCAVMLVVSGCVPPTAIAPGALEATEESSARQVTQDDEIALVQTIQAALADEGTPLAVATPEPAAGRPLEPKISASAPPVVEAFDPNSDEMRDVPSLKTLAEGWEGKTEPGYRAWSISLSSSDPARIWLVWCAINRRTLNQNYEHLRWTLEVDGESVDLDLLYRYQEDRSDRACRGFVGIVRKWPPGHHVVREIMTIDEIIHDGWDPYPAGEYVDDFVIVAR